MRKFLLAMLLVGGCGTGIQTPSERTPDRTHEEHDSPGGSDLYWGKGSSGEFVTTQQSFDRCDAAQCDTPDAIHEDNASDPTDNTSGYDAQKKQIDFYKFTAFLNQIYANGRQ
jgi:hypothetical protein